MIAAITCYKPDPLKKNWGAFKQMQELADVLIVLCDNCWVANWEPVTGSGVRIDEVIETDNKLGWTDYANKLTLMSRAVAHNCKFILFLDDDETLHGVTREKLYGHVEEMLARNWVGFEYPKWEMWDDRHVRTDGVFGKKSKLILIKNPLMEESVHWRGNHLQRLHALPTPIGDIGRIKDGSRLLHWGMSSPELRADRVRRHKAADPENKFQPWLDYSYMTNEDGIVLEAIK